MEIIPAIDLIDGKCVRLFKGRFDHKKEYSADPIGIAKSFKEAGAHWIHVIDLDGAKSGIPKNLEIAIKIKRDLNVRIEYGGGIRDIETLSTVLKKGIDRPILGTKAIEDIAFLKDAMDISGGSAMLSLDYDHECMIWKKGWQESCGTSIFDLAQKIKKIGVDTIITTDISRDGTLEGIDVLTIKKILKKTGLKLYIAGGVTNISDIQKLKEMEPLGIAGVIMGKAIYEGTIHLKEALSIGG